MKKTIITLLVCVLFFGITQKSFAQTSLQFNQVVYQTISGGGSTTLVVPASSVLKIESFGPPPVYRSGGYYYYIYLDGVTLGVISGDAVIGVLTPIWLPTGSYTFSCDADVSKAFISGILFNVN